MMRQKRIRLARAMVALPLTVLAGGCVVRTAAHVVTLPVRAVGQAADWATTSQDEADRNRGREMRRQEKRAEKAARQRAKACREAGNTDCS